MNPKCPATCEVFYDHTINIQQDTVFWIGPVCDISKTYNVWVAASASMCACVCVRFCVYTKNA